MAVANCRQSFFNDQRKGSVARHHHLNLIVGEGGFDLLVFLQVIDQELMHRGVFVLQRFAH